MYGTTITFEGNLATDLQIKENRDGGLYVDAVILVNQGQDRPATRWNVRITGRTAENIANLTKGDRLLVTGSVVTDSWTDKETGDTRYSTKVLAQAVGVSFTFDRVTDIQRNPAKRDQEHDQRNHKQDQ